MNRDSCETAVIGAGPYGLSVAAHLKAAKISTRTFGEAMGFWANNMPKGMKLRSPWRASNLSDPHKDHDLAAWAKDTGIIPTDRLPLEEFVRYGRWFQSRAVPDLDTRKVKRVASAAKGFRLELEDGEPLFTNRVVMAMGLANQAQMLREFDGLPSDLVSHSSEVVEPAAYKGRKVAVIGRGQSAVESAVLLSEAGADVELICRGDVHWIGSEAPGANMGDDVMFGIRDFLESKSAVGPFPLNWLVDAPTLLHMLPANLRSLISVRSLRAAATAWLKARAKDVHINAGRTLLAAKAKGSQIELQFDNGSSTFDHTVLATGYRIDVAKFGILSPELVRAVNASEGCPLLNGGFESSVRGLHFVGASAVKSFGPLPRFVAGAGYVASSLTRAVVEAAEFPEMQPVARPVMAARSSR